MKARILVLGALLVGMRVDAADVLVHCGKLLDPAQGTYITGAVITIRDGKVASVGAGNESGAAFDLSGVTCLPGLIDVHVHLIHDPRNSGYNSLGISVLALR